jgi:AcrR family transcriptional regulator/predicted DNA-binding transcriptional regulator AlpA
MKKKTKFMRISELEEASGVPRTTIHYYTREGILPPALKTGRTMAYYDERHLTRLLEVEKIKKETGLPLSFIQEQARAISRTRRGRKKQKAVSFESEGPETPRDQRRQEIAQAAIEIFSKKGFHETTVAEITQGLGISTGTFYIYFQDKQELFLEVVDQVVRRIVGGMAQAIKGETDLWRRWVIRARTFFENFERYNEILHQLRAEMTHGGWPQGRVEEIFLKITRPLIQEIRQAEQQGLIRHVDPELLAFSLMGIIEGVTLRSRFDDKYTFHNLIAFVGDVIFTGLDPAKTGPQGSGSR